MSRNYKFHNPEGLYFISFSVVGWLDVFTRNEYKDLFLESLRFGQKKRFEDSIIENPKESRKEFLLYFFGKETAKSSDVAHYQFWRHDNKPIELWSNRVIKQK